MLKNYCEEFQIDPLEGLPPCSLKEIYQLPHKGKGKESEEVKEDKKKKGVNEIKFDVSSILQVKSTKYMSDVCEKEEE